MTSPDVLALQKILIADGYLKVTAPTNYYGTATQAAVKLYQKAHGIQQTGSVGTQTLAALNAGSTTTTPVTTQPTTPTTTPLATPATIISLQQQLAALQAQLLAALTGKSKGH
jgi:peptidoglycan hydrolase-like protein with peptidoglycan-binding domain